MYYVILAQDNPNMLEKRIEVRSAHLARLEKLQAECRPQALIRQKMAQV